MRKEAKHVSTASCHGMPSAKHVRHNDVLGSNRRALLLTHAGQHGPKQLQPYRILPAHQLLPLHNCRRHMLSSRLYA